MLSDKEKGNQTVGDVKKGKKRMFVFMCIYTHYIRILLRVYSLYLQPKPKYFFPLAVPQDVQDLLGHFYFLN